MDNLFITFLFFLKKATSLEQLTDTPASFLPRFHIKLKFPLFSFKLHISYFPLACSAFLPLQVRDRGKEISYLGGSRVIYLW